MFDPDSAGIKSTTGAKDSRAPASLPERLWRRKPTAAAVEEAARMVHARALITNALSNRMAGMSPRDLRLYLRLASEYRPQALQALRFDCFDLMCRHLSEVHAAELLRQIDVCLKPRR